MAIAILSAGVSRAGKPWVRTKALVADVLVLATVIMAPSIVVIPTDVLCQVREGARCPIKQVENPSVRV